MFKISLLFIFSVFVATFVSAQGLMKELFGNGSTPAREPTTQEIEKSNIEFENLRALGEADFEPLKEIVSLIPLSSKSATVPFSEALEPNPLSTFTSRQKLHDTNRKALQSRLIRYLDFIQDNHDGNETALLSKGLSIRRLRDFIKTDLFIFYGADVSPVASFVTDAYEQSLLINSQLEDQQNGNKVVTSRDTSAGSASSLPQVKLDQKTLEFLGKTHKSFNTLGHVKSKGINLTLSYPCNWDASEGQGPNILQTFVSDNGFGSEMALLITKDIPMPSDAVLTKEEVKEILSPTNLRESVPSSAKLIDAKLSEIHSQPVGILEYTMISKQSGNTVLVHALTLNFMVNKTLLMVQFQVIGKVGSEIKTAHRMEGFKPLFYWIANSMLFQDQSLYSKTNSAPNSERASSFFSSSIGDFSFLSILFSFLVTWGIGLTPPLLIRYVFFRRPLTSKTASWISAVCSIFFWMAFRIIASAFELKSGGGTVWIIIFVVSRWIMSRDISKSSKTINRNKK